MKNDQEEMFWLIVQTAPYVEADQMLRQRRHDAMQRKIEAADAGEGIEVDKLNLLLTRINDELHRINRINRDFHMQQAIKAVCGAEAWELVKVWLMENQDNLERK